ncbi:hypothetical protein D3C86_2008450 [compost metagenome]
MLPQQDQVLVLVVQHVDQIDKALLRGNRAFAQWWQVIDHPAVEATAQLQIVHHRRGAVAQVGEGEADTPSFAEPGLELPGADRQ